MGKIVLLLALICQFSIAVNAQNIFVGQSCKVRALFPSDNSPYEININLLLSNLVSKSSSLKFYNYTVGVDLEIMYGFFQCRYDLGFDICNACVKKATQVEKCPFDNETIVWYNECMLRYADRDIFSLNETSPSTYQWSYGNVSDYDKFAPILATTMNDVIKNASSALPHYGSGITSWTLHATLYSFAQCTPDIDTFGCHSCLKSALSTMTKCCSQSTRVAVFSPSCELWYDLSPFLKDQHIPLDHSSTPPPSISQVLSSKGSSFRRMLTITAVSASVGLLLIAVVVWICLCRRKPKEASSGVPPTSPTTQHDVTGETDARSLGDTEFIQYDFKTLKIATNDFSTENVLGEGGFGIVYKGTLENEEQLAIKRLSDTSRQGSKEFMAEARFLAKLQHKNLVKLVGFCYEKEEKLLVYEFMSNASLDRLLFDARKKPLLNWETRYKIIMGIARGLQYLHEDSRLTIIHRDLKPGNILLDKDMNPKIADFGLAKLFGNAQKFGRTTQIVGTQGYMAPEYMMAGTFSNKSDIYSFGIMLLEIISGHNNIKFYQSPRKEDLPSHARRLWNEGRSFDLVDPALYNNCWSDDVMRCIQIGLLCLEPEAEQRPAITLVVHMLTGSIDLPLPSTSTMSFHQFSMAKVGYSTCSGEQSGIFGGKDLYPKPS